MKKLIMLGLLIVLAAGLYAEEKSQLTLTKEQANEIYTLVEKRLTDIDHDLDIPFLGTLEEGVEELNNQEIRAYVKEALYKKCVSFYDPSGKNDANRTKKVKDYLNNIRELVESLLVSYNDRFDITKQTIKDMKVTLYGKENAIYPGKWAFLIIHLTAENGIEFVTAGYGEGKIGFDQFKIELEGASLENPEYGGIVLSYGALESMQYTDVKYTIQYKRNPEVIVKGQFAIKYNTAIIADFSGAPGNSGASGRDGKTAFYDDGSDGGIGGKGSNGGNGKNGENIDVKLELITHPKTNEKLIHAVINSTTSGRNGDYLVAVNGGNLTILASGGAGGEGGSGGRGGDGRGIPSNKGSKSGDGGDGGDGGNGGNGGNGGKITVTATSAVMEYKELIRFGNQGGDAGGKGSSGFYGNAGPVLSGQTNGEHGRMGQYGDSGEYGASGPSVQIKVIG